jgi:hypothetical protein
MPDSQFANANESMPTTAVAVESKEQPTNSPSVKLYEVWISAHVKEKRHKDFSGKVADSPPDRSPVLLGKRSLSAPSGQG